MKRRVIQLLVKLSDFEAVQADPAVQDNLMQGVMKIFQSEESDNADLCLKMGCVEYFRNFFNDGEFRVNAF